MGITASKINATDDNNLVEEEKITVNFVEVKKKQGSNVTPEQLNLLLGLDVPKYSILEGNIFPYLFCVSLYVDIESILRDYGYEIGNSTKQKVFRNEFNSNHRIACSRNGIDFKIFTLEHI